MTVTFQSQPVQSAMASALKMAMTRNLVMRGSPLADDYTAYFGEPNGKVVRGTLALMFTQMLTEQFQQGLSAACAVELLHLASIVVDDWMDDAHIRHGKQTVVSRYGARVALAVARHLLYRSLVEFASYRSQYLFRRARTVVNSMIAGQRQEAHNMRLGTWDCYCKCIYGKTASLFGLACEAGVVIAGEEHNRREDAREFGHGIGMAFQIMDDYLDFFGATELGKRVGTDFFSGINSAPILLFASRSADHAQRVRELMSQPSRTADQFQELREDMLREGTADETLAAAHAYTDRGKQRLRSFPDTRCRAALLAFATSLTRRTH